MDYYDFESNFKCVLEPFYRNRKLTKSLPCTFVIYFLKIFLRSVLLGSPPTTFRVDMKKIGALKSPILKRTI